MHRSRGRLVDPQWTANLRAERDLLRQLVPVISPAADPELVEGKPEAMIASATTVHDPHPDRPKIPADYGIEDANADFFDYPPYRPGQDAKLSQNPTLTFSLPSLLQTRAC